MEGGFTTKNASFLDPMMKNEFHQLKKDFPKQHQNQNQNRDQDKKFFLPTGPQNRNTFEQQMLVSPEYIQQADNIFAKTIMYGERIQILLQSLLTNTIELIYLEVEERLTRKSRSFTRRRKALTPKRRKSIGGESSQVFLFKEADEYKQHVVGMDNNKRLQIELETYLSDSMHDFKHSKRTEPWTSELINSTTGEYNSIIIDELARILEDYKYDELFLEKYNGTTNFEKLIQIDYLLGFLTNDKELQEEWNVQSNMNYYFTFQDKIPTEWVKKRIEFHSKNIPNPLDKMFVDVDNYNEFLYDACVPFYKTINEKKKEVLSLSNLWDPKTFSTTKDKLFEFKFEKGKYFVKEETFDEYIIYDWKNEKGTSVYDDLYSDLLNPISIREILQIHLRLAVNKDNSCHVFVKLKPLDAQKNSYSFILKGGLSVKELQFGLKRINKLDFQENVTPRVAELIKMIDYLESLDISGDNIKNILFWFKSSGDHGQTNTVQYINTQLTTKCLYVSGDMLSVVHSISSKCPTMFTYQKQSKEGKDVDENEEDDLCEDTNNIFMGVYLPPIIDITHMVKKLNQYVKTIQELFQFRDEEIQLSEMETIQILKDEKLDDFNDWIKWSDWIQQKKEDVVQLVEEDLNIEDKIKQDLKKRTMTILLKMPEVIRSNTSEISEKQSFEFKNEIINNLGKFTEVLFFIKQKKEIEIYFERNLKEITIEFQTNIDHGLFVENSREKRTNKKIRFRDTFNLFAEKIQIEPDMPLDKMENYFLNIITGKKRHGEFAEDSQESENSNDKHKLEHRGLKKRLVKKREEILQDIYDLNISKNLVNEYIEQTITERYNQLLEKLQRIPEIGNALYSILHSWLLLKQKKKKNVKVNHVLSNNIDTVLKKITGKKRKIPKGTRDLLTKDVSPEKENHESPINQKVRKTRKSLPGDVLSVPIKDFSPSKVVGQKRKSRKQIPIS